MLNLKNTKLLCLFSFMLAGMVLGRPQGVGAIPAGCPEGPPGPPSAGTVCPDGSVPVKDDTLPAGCPGSSQSGPIGSDATFTCPARPGRAACTYSQATRKCVDADGTDLTKGDVIAEANNFSGDCMDVDLSKDCGVVNYIVRFTQVLSMLVGVVIVIMIAIGGVQYSAARDNPQAVTAARGRIINALLALVVYIFSLALLQWLVPGGILR